MRIVQVLASGMLLRTMRACATTAHETGKKLSEIGVFAVLVHLQTGSTEARVSADFSTACLFFSFFSSRGDRRRLNLELKTNSISSRLHGGEGMEG
jgi:hypothetical protein